MTVTPGAATDAAVNDWFDQNFVRYMQRDVSVAIAGGANFGAALMLVCYTEVLGGVKTGSLGRPGNSAANFNAGLLRLDEAAVTDGCAPNYYSAFAVQLNGHPAIRTHQLGGAPEAHLRR